MSLKSVPGCLVLIAPMLIGVPVAATPGLVPHDEVETVLAGAELDDAAGDEAAALDAGDEAAAEELRKEFPHACIVAVFLPGMLLQEDEVGAAPTIPGVDKSAGSLGHAVQICLDMHKPAPA